MYEFKDMCVCLVFVEGAANFKFSQKTSAKNNQNGAMSNE